MVVYFYQMTKRNRSTKVPTSESYVSVTAYLKEGTSIIKPVLLLQTFVAGTYNYFYIPDFNRYYFVTDAKSVENMWEVAGTEDYLASYKSSIGSTSCTILYAAGSTKNIIDSRIPVLATVSQDYTYTAISDVTITTGTGAIILGLTGKGSFGPYLLKNSTDIPDMLDGIEDFADLITDTFTFTKQLFYGGSAAECLRSAIALPLIISAADVSSGTAEDLYLGNYPCTNSNGNAIQGYHITKPVISFITTIDIPWLSSDWKMNSQYTDICVYLPLIGLISVPATEVMTDSSLTINYSINVTSGDISIEIYGTTSTRKVCTASGNCAMPTAYGSTGINTSKLTSAIVTGAGTLIGIGAAVATGGISALATAAIGSGLAATAGQTISAMGGSGSGSGGLGGGANQGLDSVIKCFVTQKELTDTQSNFETIMGAPFMGVSTPNQFSGYIQTDGFQFEHVQAFSSEKDMINQLMDSGIYYE